VLARIPPHQGLEYTADDHNKLVESGGRCYLLSLPAKQFQRQSLHIRRYLRNASKGIRIRDNSTFSKRRFWFSIDDLGAPDAFVSYMHNWSPRLIRNALGAGCTNNIHRLWWLSNIGADAAKLIAISLLS